MAETAETLIRVADLRREYKMGDQVVHALDGVSLEIQAGEFTGIMGPSGSGKSTLLYLLGGLDRATGGQIWVHDQEITALDENDLAGYRGKKIGFIFQSFHLIPSMTALQNVEFPMIFSRIPPDVRRQRAQTLLETVGLENRMHHKPTELSGGQQQRVAMARALVNDPQIILADEPTGNLDTRIGAEVMNLLKKLNEEQKRTIIIVSHDPTLTRYVTREIRLLDGQIVTPQSKESNHA